MKYYLFRLSLFLSIVYSCSDGNNSTGTPSTTNKSDDRTAILQDKQISTKGQVGEAISKSDFIRHNHFLQKADSVLALIHRESEWLSFSNINAAFTACINNDSIFIRSGEHRLKSSLELWEKNNIVVTGEGHCKVIAENTDDNVMWIITCHNITIRNLHATHTKPSEDERCYGNVFALDMGRDITIENCDINGCGAIGVYIFGTRHVVLKDNFIHDNTLWAIDDDGHRMNSEEESDNILFEGNRYANNGYLNENY